MARGGARQGAGRPKIESKMVIYNRSVRPEWVNILDSVLRQLRNEFKKHKKTE